MEEDEGGGGDRADAPEADADPAQRLEGGLKEGIAALLPALAALPLP